jgi:hypothetical protein
VAEQVIHDVACPASRVVLLSSGILQIHCAHCASTLSW